MTQEPDFDLVSAEPILIVQEVNKRFATVHAVRNVSFTVPKGSIFALLGPNGAGKTTLVRMLLHINRPDSGHIAYRVDGRQTAVLPPQQVGYLPEERGLYKDQPILKTLIYMAVLRGMPRQEALPAATRWLERFDLLDRKNDRLETLSKGNQQKVQLISAILHGPLIAFLDEPFSGLDPLNQEIVSEIIRGLACRGMTVVLSAHQMELVDKLADHLVLLGHGDKILEGPIEQVRRTYPIPKELIVHFMAVPQITGVPELMHVERLEDRVLRITAQDSLTKNDLVRFAASLGEIEQLHSQELNLHDVYVRSVKEHSAKGRSAN